MNLKEFEDHLAHAKEVLGTQEGIDIVFSVPNRAPWFPHEEVKTRYMYFNTITVYTEERIIALSLEGPMTEIWRRELEAGTP